jgi:hypothetical protein
LCCPVTFGVDYTNRQETGSHKIYDFDKKAFVLNEYPFFRGPLFASRQAVFSGSASVDETFSGDAPNTRNASANFSVEVTDYIDPVTGEQTAEGTREGTHTLNSFGEVFEWTLCPIEFNSISDAMVGPYAEWCGPDAWGADILSRVAHGSFPSEGVNATCNFSSRNPPTGDSGFPWYAVESGTSSYTIEQSHTSTGETRSFSSSSSFNRTTNGQTDYTTTTECEMTRTITYLEPVIIPDRYAGLFREEIQELRNSQYSNIYTFIAGYSEIDIISVESMNEPFDSYFFPLERYDNSKKVSATASRTIENPDQVKTLYFKVIKQIVTIDAMPIGNIRNSFEAIISSTKEESQFEVAPATTYTWTEDFELEVTNLAVGQNQRKLISHTIVPLPPPEE